MIYEFKSRATGSVIMTKPVAEWILGIVGKAPGRTGIITVDQMPAAVAALRRAIEGEKQAQREAEKADSVSAADAADAEDDDYPISLARRAFPFIELLETSHAAGKDVTWGV
ncbi:MAG: DUF1840 domain-containing protein [Burkholderiales bacterium]|nr:DUF1840 domain-containing protein [Burkholderiales bacterium]OJX07822.1 MAG: hypothetical protein BGO72_18980 [Burkholderiales bacterium 70-64]